MAIRAYEAQELVLKAAHEKPDRDLGLGVDGVDLFEGLGVSFPDDAVDVRTEATIEPVEFLWAQVGHIDVG